jgi:hypothetical protein
MRKFTKNLRVLLSKKDLKANDVNILTIHAKEKIENALIFLLQYCSGILNDKLVLLRAEFVVDKDDDFLIRFSSDSKVAIFNTAILQKCSLDFYILIMAHEAIHGIFQGLPNKTDVKKLNDYFVFWMPIVDVSADAHLAEFLHKKLNYSCKKYFEIYSTGINAFKDFEIRPHKLQRFISSTITIYRYFKTGKNEIYFIPDKIASVLGKEDQMELPAIYISNWGLAAVKWIKLPTKILTEFTSLYTNDKLLSSKTYSKRIIGLCELLFESMEQNDKQEVKIVFM